MKLNIFILWNNQVIASQQFKICNKTKLNNINQINQSLNKFYWSYTDSLFYKKFFILQVLKIYYKLQIENKAQLKLLLLISLV